MLTPVPLQVYLPCRFRRSRQSDGIADVVGLGQIEPNSSVRRGGEGNASRLPTGRPLAC